MKIIENDIEGKLKLLSAILDKYVIRLTPEDVEVDSDMKADLTDIEEKIRLLAIILDEYAIKITPDELEKADVEFKIRGKYNSEIYFFSKEKNFDS